MHDKKQLKRFHTSPFTNEICKLYFHSAQNSVLRFGVDH